MDNIKVEEFIEEINNIIFTTFKGFKGIYFFGSRNDENWSKESDLELMFVFNRDLKWKEKEAIMNKLFETEVKYDYLIDAKFGNINKLKDSNNPFREVIDPNAVFYGV